MCRFLPINKPNYTHYPIFMPLYAILFGWFALLIPLVSSAQRRVPIVFAGNENQEIHETKTGELIARYRKVRIVKNYYNQDLGDPYITVDTLGRVGAIDMFGNTLIPFEYDNLSTFKKGISIAELDGAKGIIDYQNHVLVPFEYDEIVLSRVYEGLENPKIADLLVNWNVILVRKGTRWYWKTLQNELLNVVNPPPFDWDGGVFTYQKTSFQLKYFNDFKGKNFAFYTGKKGFAEARFNRYKVDELREIADDDYGLRENRDSLSIAFANDTIHLFLNYTRFKLANDTLLLLGNRNYWQLFNYDFKPVGSRYEKITPIGMTCLDWRLEDDKLLADTAQSRHLEQKAYFIVEEKGKKGVMNLQGQLIIPLQYDDIQPFRATYYRQNEYLLLIKNNLVGLADATGIVWLPPYATFINHENSQHEWIDIVRNNEYSAFNSNTHALLPFLPYNSLEISAENYAIVTYNKQVTVYDRKAKKVAFFADTAWTAHYANLLPIDSTFQLRLAYYKQLEKIYQKVEMTNYPMAMAFNHDTVYCVGEKNRVLFKKKVTELHDVQAINKPTNYFYFTKDSSFLSYQKTNAGEIDLVIYDIKTNEIRFKTDLNKPFTLLYANKNYLFIGKLNDPKRYTINLNRFAIDSTILRVADLSDPELPQKTRLEVKNSDYYSAVLDGNGNRIISFRYDAMRAFRGGYARVRRNWRCGYVETNGNEPLPVHFDYAEDIKNKRALVLKDGVWFFLKLRID